jgi:hypothetical protein
VVRNSCVVAEWGGGGALVFTAVLVHTMDAFTAQKLEISALLIFGAATAISGARSEAS